MISKPTPVFMIAAECRGLTKVGGLADVVRDLSKALVDLNVPVNVVIPFYDVIQIETKAPVFQGQVRFGKLDWKIKVFCKIVDGANIYLIRNEHFFGGEYGTNYVDSDRLGRGPFEDDAKRFAFFSAAAIEFIKQSGLFPNDGTLHCHDWHSGAMLCLLKLDPRYKEWGEKFSSIFTIHNLDYQGVRPFEWTGKKTSVDYLAFNEWFPDLYAQISSSNELDLIRDPRALHCFNPMRAGILLADIVNTVSPTYAKEITLPDDPSSNFIGGRGLEADLQIRFNQGRMQGILNGLDYDLFDPRKLTPPFDISMPEWIEVRKVHKRLLLAQLSQELQGMAARLGVKFKNSQVILDKLLDFSPSEWFEKPVVIAVTRMVSQKMSILLEPFGNSTLLDAILKKDVLVIVFGSGELEARFEVLNRHRNGFFICAYDEKFANGLYSGGDIFLMPSDFEPCGISQMMAMRFGCLPFANDIGGLHDTVRHYQNGFIYRGNTREQARLTFMDIFDGVIDCYQNHTQTWEALQRQAMLERFGWETSAIQYLNLYRNFNRGDSTGEVE